ncbi:MAG: triphosphoribosyl-dephospho-CoA synthase [Pirellulales bacterium]|nr:triphosphoribosyl-dephospho-CoA synthase [Pirellulales bacterium]
MTDPVRSTPPLPHPSCGACATLACIWEVSAFKPGNVYPGADFENATCADFFTSAAVIGPVMEQVPVLGVGKAVRNAVEATQLAVGANTNLGTLLLLAPLAAVPASRPLVQGVAGVLGALGIVDTQNIYEAIRLAAPGALGTVASADVNAPQSPPLTPVEVMRLAAQRDLVARQYVNQFEQVFEVADQIECGMREGLALGDSIVRAFLVLLAAFPDSLIARKCGAPVAEEATRRAAGVLAAGRLGESVVDNAIRDFDSWLRSDGHRRNPGTSADLVAAGLFTLLREQRINWPVRFYREARGVRIEESEDCDLGFC